MLHAIYYILVCTAHITRLFTHASQCGELGCSCFMRMCVCACVGACSIYRYSRIYSY